jgi:phytoene desaturase
LKIAIIGAGIAGIASSLRLKALGHEVTVFETNKQPGGKLHEFSLNGFRFDAGPSLFTMPQFVDELFELVNKNPREYFNYKKIDISCHYFYEDGTKINGYSDKEMFGKEVEEKLKIPKKIVVDFLNHSLIAYQTTAHIFLEKSLHLFKSYCSFKVIESLLHFHKLNLFTNMNKFNSRKLKHPKLVQLFNRFATYNGSDPYRAPAILNIIPSLEHHFGTYFPLAGMYDITNSLFQLSISQDVKYYFAKKVTEIIIENKKVTGLKVENEIFNFDIVLSNMDVVLTYKYLLPKEKINPKVENQERSSSALIFYWGINKEFTQLGLHNIFFSENYKEEFKVLSKEKNIYSDPTIYINVSSIECKKDAPPNCQNWFILINAPYNDNQNWEDIIIATKKNVIAKLSRILKEDISKLIVEEKILDPIKIEQKTNSYKGSLYGTSSNGIFSSFIRHPNFSKKVKGLYFCGGSVHPGGGIPLCLQSAKIVSEIINQDCESRK